MPLKIIGVSELNYYLKEKLDQDRLLRNIWVKGEISNFKHHSSGHMYFTLKDSQSSLKAVMFKSFSASLPFKPTNGISVLARGNISIFQRDGQYQLYVEELQPEGYGANSLAIEQLKKKLFDEGLLDPSKKQTIPILPGKIGIVSSPTGAAIKDILTVMLRRFPQVRVVLSPTIVQGEQAPEQIAQAIKNLAHFTDIDVIIVSRGGGSLEELAAFNSEKVARAIYESPIPVITGVGHETDITIADLVADVRAATPSAAAELAVPVKEELKQVLKNLQRRLEYNMQGKIISARRQLSHYENIKVIKSPQTILDQKKQIVDQLEQKLINSISNNLLKSKTEFAIMVEKLNLLNPLAVLTRGYSICRHYENKQIINSSAQVQLGQDVEVILKKDTLICQVKGIKEANNESAEK